MSDKTIIRVERNKNNPYMMLERKLAGNKAISYEALGLLTYLFSKPDDWQVQVADLVREGCSRNKVYGLLKTLRTLGYVERIDHRNDKRRFTHFEYVIREKPVPKKLEVEKLDLENGDALLSSESLPSTENNITAPKGADAAPPTSKPVRAHKPTLREDPLIAAFLEAFSEAGLPLPIPDRDWGYRAGLIKAAGYTPAQVKATVRDKLKGRVEVYLFRYLTIDVPEYLRHTSKAVPAPKAAGPPPAPTPTLYQTRETLAARGIIVGEKR